MIWHWCAGSSWVLKISDQNNWGGGGPEQKIKFGGAKFKGGPKILGEVYELQ